MPPASRMAARLADLSHAQLVEIAAAGCEASTEVKNRADAILAAHKPLAQWLPMVTMVDLRVGNQQIAI